MILGSSRCSPTDASGLLPKSQRSSQTLAVTDQLYRLAVENAAETLNAVSGVGHDLRAVGVCNRGGGVEST